MPSFEPPLKAGAQTENGYVMQYVFLNYLRCHDDIGRGLDTPEGQVFCGPGAPGALCKTSPAFVRTCGPWTSGTTVCWRLCGTSRGRKSVVCSISCPRTRRSHSPMLTGNPYRAGSSVFDGGRNVKMAAPAMPPSISFFSVFSVWRPLSAPARCRMGTFHPQNCLDLIKTCDIKAID